MLSFNQKNYFFIVICIVTIITLTACNGFFDKDNIPAPSKLTKFTPEIKPTLLWSIKASYGTGSEFLKLTPVLYRNAIYTADTQGAVTAINKFDGTILWRKYTQAHLTTGPGAGNGLIVVGSRKGSIIALSAQDGQERWRIEVPGQILANPTVSKGTILIKRIDGMVHAFSINGSELWTYQQTEPSLLLRGSSSALINKNNVIIGFANGNLVKLNLDDGDLVWEQTIAIAEGAFSIQRMIDIDADPILYKQHIYAATYQGNIAAIDWYSGRTRWSHDISSYTGMTADDNALFISDASGHVWSFNTNNGIVNWRQRSLEARVLSGPAQQGNYIIVGDAEGYLHWLNKIDGRFAARIHVGGKIYAAPITDENGVIYTLSNQGYLSAYKLS